MCKNVFSFLNFANWFFVHSQVIIRARNLRAAANFIPPKSYRARRHYYSNEVRVLYLIGILLPMVLFQ